MFEINLFDILTFGAASAAALTAWLASQGYESTTRRLENTLERGFSKTGGRASSDAATVKRLDAMDKQSGQIARDVKGLVDANANAHVETASLAQNVAGLSELARQSNEDAQGRHNEIGQRIDAATAAIREELTTVIGAKAAGALSQRLTTAITTALAGKSGDRIAKAVVAAAKKEMRREKAPTPPKPRQPRAGRKPNEAPQTADGQSESPDATTAAAEERPAAAAAEPPEGSEAEAAEQTGSGTDAAPPTAPPEGAETGSEAGKPAPDGSGDDKTAAD